MIFNYPFFRFNNKTHPYRPYNYANYGNLYNNSLLNKQENFSNIPQTKTQYILDNKHIDSNTNFSNNKNFIQNEHFLSILGIKLYFDDLIILALLFFLYNEGVKDEGLFICLILLLIS